tara:strand:- start:12 stop:662 length:651 start_codon:yes stop_codon:yes gene_type:complete
MIIHSQIIKLDNGNIIMNQREQAARGMMSAGIGSLSGLEDTRRDSDPLNGHYIMNGRTNQFVQERNGETVNNSTRDFWTADNSNTGTRYTSTNVDTPTWSYERNTDPSGFGQERYNNDPFINFMMKGGGQDYDGRGLPKGIETLVAELTEDQMNMMGNMYNTPALGGVSKEDLYNKTKDMEDTGFFGFGAQEPTTREEFEDYYRKLQQGTVGNWIT